MKVAIAVVALTLAIGCASKYQPFTGALSGGYREHKLAPDIYEVEYTSGFHPPRSQSWAGLTHYADDFRLLRGAELTLGSGHQYFIVKADNTGRHSYPLSRTIVIKMFVTKPKVDSVVFVYHAETDLVFFGRHGKHHVQETFGVAKMV